MPKKINPEEPVKSAAEAPVKKKMGRPPVEIDKETFEFLVTGGCGLNMVAGYYKLKTGSCSPMTIERYCKKEYGLTFVELQKLLRENIKSQIRMKQIEVALKGDTKMLIWLGKCWLGQRENGTEQTGDVNKVNKLYEALMADDIKADAEAGDTDEI